MDEPSQAAQAVIAQYRDARGSSVELRARVRARLAQTIASESLPLVTRPKRMRGAPVVVAVLAMAAAVVLVLGWPPRQALESSPVAPTQAADDALAPRDPSIAVPVPAELPRVVPTRSPTPAAAPPMQPRDSRPTPPTDDAAVDAGLARELALLREAKRQLAAGEARASLTTLGEHARTFASGQLAEERDAYRIEALCMLGEHVQAGGERAVFERRHPQSTHLVRIARACD